MNTNFNMVKKPKKEDKIDEEIEEIELDDDKPTTSNSDVARKRMFKMMGFIVGGMFILLFILYIVSLFTTKDYSYTELEGLLKNAAISYFKDYPDSLPQADGDIVEIDSSNLVAAEKMKTLSEYTGEGVACSGVVQVEKAGEEFLYTPYLNCGDNYLTEELYKKIISDENLVSTGYGLYANNGNYIYRGEDVDNYVKLGNSLWRIVKVTANNNIVLIHQDGILYSQPWDNRYNEGKFYAAGFNNYNSSRVKEFLEKVYNNPNKDEQEDILSKKDKANLVSYNLCIGKRANNSETKDNSEECNEVLNNQKLGLLTLSDYLYASIDPNCKSSLSKSCQNYNYLILKDKTWWLATGDKNDTSKVYSVQSNGVVEAMDASNYNIIRPVIYLNSKVLYKSGDGSLEKPFKIK